MPPTPLTRLPAKAVQRLLLAIEEVRKRQVAGEEVAVPLTTVHLRSGRELVGWVLSMGAGPDEGSALLHLANPDRSPSEEVAYTDVSQIVAVTVHEAEKSAHLISFGAITVPAGPAPNKLELRRKLQKLGEDLSEKLGKSIACEVDWTAAEEQEDDARRRLQAGLIDVTAILREVGETSAGLEALKVLDRVTFSMGASVVSRAGSLLTIPGAPPSRPALSRESLKAGVESAL